MVTTSPSANLSFTSVPPGSVSDPSVADGPGAQPPVQLVDPVGEDDQFVGALDRLGRVAVIADHAAVISDLDLQVFAPLPQPVQLRGEVLLRRVRH